MSAPCPTLGFHLAFTIASTVAEGRRGAVLAEFRDLVERHGLVAAPAGEGASDFLISGDGTQATESDRQRLIAWLDDQPEVVSHEAGPVVDLSERT